MAKIFKLLFILFLLHSSATIAAPAKDLWPYWQTSNPKSTKTIEHAQYETFLNKYIQTNPNDVNLVAYSEVTPTDRQILNNYIDYLSTIKIGNYNSKEQLAYWINLYNALTIKVVLEHMPVKSILDIKLSGPLTTGPWDKQLVQIEGKQLSLNDIEHRIVRPIWNDPRTHFALNCASYSCPNLQKTPYTAKNVDQMLDTSAKQYINNPRGVTINPKNKLIISQIFDWYSSDFGKTPSDIIKFINKYANPQLQQQLINRTAIDSYAYDWSLNGK